MITHRPEPETVESIQYVEKEVIREVKVRDKGEVKTVREWLPDGSVKETVEEKKDLALDSKETDKLSVIQETKVDIRPDRMVGLSVKMDQNSLKSQKPSGYSALLNQRLFGGVWGTLEVSDKREVSIGVLVEL